MSNVDKMKYWLLQSDYTISELADEIGCNVAQVHRWIKRQLNIGNVECVCIRKGNSRSKAYTWCGNDDIQVLALKAAEYLRDVVATDEAKAIARKIFIANERT